MEDLKDKTAIVTGAAGGMGEAVARVLASQGCKVALLDLNEEQVKISAESAGGTALEQLGEPRILVNCAGILRGARIAGKDGPHDLEMFKQVIDVNLVGTFNTMRVAASIMTNLSPVTESGERGVIVNVASISAFEGQIGQAAYSASKGGVVAMTLPATRELAQFGVRVMALAPGVVGTPMIKSLPDKLQENLSQASEFPKRMAEPEEIGKLVLHIVQNEYLNGEVIRIDGGTRFQGK
jgi:NAD(P)-dependent dehydrogenase (short-subunit alcohol dehydrogenase family)